MYVRALATACLLAGGMGLTSARADDAPLPRLELDKRIARSVHDSALLGSDLWAEKNYEGTFRLYQGTLLAVEPLLDHHPKLAELVKERLDQAEELDPLRGSFALRQAMDAVLKQTSEALKPQTAWARLRGEQGARAIARDFLLAAATDPKVNVTRGGRIKIDAKSFDDLQQWLVERISQATGGPLRYTGPEPRTAFAGMKVTEEEFKAALEHLAAVLKDYQVQTADATAILEAFGKLKSQVVGQ